MKRFKTFEFSDYKKCENHENKVPVLLYGLDLKYWGENDIKPAEVPRNNADCHRFWRPSDERLTKYRHFTLYYFNHFFHYFSFFH